MKNRSKAATGILLTTLSALLYGTLPVFANLSYAAGSNAETFNFYKSAWAIPVLAVLVLLRRQPVRLPKRLALWAVLAGVLGKGITSLFLFLSYNYVSGGVATTLHFMYPLFAALLGWVFFHERLPLYKWLTLLVSTLAVSLFVDTGSGAASLTGVFYALASAVVYAVFIVVIDKSGIAQLDPFVFALYLACSGSVFSLLFGMGTGTLHLAVSFRAGFFAACAAVVTSAIAIACFQRGIRLLGGANAAFFSMLEPVGSCVLGYLFLQETITVRAMAGIALILGAELVMIWLDSRRHAHEGSREKA